MTIYLYVKTHNVTKLKYLGKTTQNPYEYKGSGILWKRHIEKYGDDVSTDIIFQSENSEAIKEKGIYYSKLWNVVESKEWANLIEENGIGGDTSKYIDYKKVGLKNRGKDTKGTKNSMYGKRHTEETKYKMRMMKIGIPKTEEHKKKAALARLGKKRGPYKRKIIDE